MPWITAVFALRDSFIESLAPAVPHTCAESSALGLSRRAADACVNVENFAQMFSLISIETCPTAGIYLYPSLAPVTL